MTEQTAVLSAGTEHTCHLNPVVLFRRGTVFFADLDQLVPAQALALSAALETAEHRLAAITDPLCEVLHDAVPAMPQAARRALLKVRRSIFNGAIPAPDALRSAGAALGSVQSARLDAWLDRAEERDRLAAELTRTFDRETEQGRAALRAVVRTPDFQRGLQLSGPHLYRNARGYLDDPARLGTKRARKTEAALVSFAYRVALKPSPFGSFTEVGVHWTAAPGSRAGGSAVTALWARMFLQWLEWAVGQEPEIRRHLPLRLNNTLRVRDSVVTYLRRGTDGTAGMFDEEQIHRLTSGPLVRAVLSAIERLPVATQDTVERFLQAHGAKPEVAELAVTRAVEAGMLDQRCWVSDQETAYPARVADVLAGLGTPAAHRAAAFFADLAQAEREFAGASLTRRDEILASVAEGAVALAGQVGTEPPTADVVRSYMFEDLVTSAPSWTADGDGLDAIAGTLGTLSALLPVFDDATVERAGLRAFFVAEYGATGRCDLLSFFERFAGLGPEKITQVMTGTGDPVGERLRTIRRSFLAGLTERLTDDPGSSDLRLSSADAVVAETIAAARTLGIGWDSAAYRLQRLSDDASGRFVCNGVAAGHGVAFSRFARALEAVDPGRPEGVADTIRRLIRRRSGGRQADLAAVFGLNFNLHPPLAPLQVEYPGCVAAPEYGPVLPLTDLTVRADRESPRLLVEDPAGQLVRLVPLNYLFPAAGPMLYRLLCALAPTITLRGGLWDRLPPANALPRLLIDDVVIDRARWMYPVADVPWLDTGLQDLARWRAALRWQAETGAPRESFCRYQTSARPDGDTADWRDALRQWSLEARRGRVRKPHYLDLANPFLLTAVARQHGPEAGDRLVLSECLPSTGCYREPGGPHAAEELVVEADTAFREEVR